MEINHENINTEIAVENINYNNSYKFDELHRHAYFEFLLFHEGFDGKQIIDFVEYEISSKTLYLIMPGQVHLLKRMPHENGILIQFSKLLLDQCISPLKIDYFFKLLMVTEIKLSDEQYEAIQLLFKRTKDVYESDSLLKSQKLIRILGFIIFEIIEIVFAKTEYIHIDNIAYQFLNAVDRNVNKIKTVKAYSEILGIPKNKLTKKVNKHLGKSPLQLIHEILLIKIKRLMIVEQLSHKEIAYELNFGSQSSYSRFIKKHTSLSPSLLKEQLVQIAQ